VPSSAGLLHLGHIRRRLPLLSPRTKSPILIPTSQRFHSKQEDTYDRVPASSLDVREHPCTRETAQVAIIQESLIQYAVALELQYSGICVRAERRTSRCRAIGLADRWPAWTDRSRRTFAAYRCWSCLSVSLGSVRDVSPLESRLPVLAVSLPIFLSPLRGNPPHAIRWIARTLQGEHE